MEVSLKTKCRNTTWSSNHTLGIYPGKNIIWKDVCTPMFTVALFATAKTQKQSKCPSKNEWRWRCGTYMQWNITHHKKEWNNAICSNIEGPRDYHTKLSKSDKTNNIPFICRILKKWYNWTFLQNWNRLTDIEDKLIHYQRGGGGAISWEFGIKIYTLLYIRQITNNDLLYSTGNSMQ